MADVVAKKTRSRMMSGIRGKDTKPELIVRSYLHREGLRFRLHAKLPGKPDLVLPKYRVVVFVHGCFWHRHEDCRFATIPASNTEFWQAKFDGNMRHDADVRKQLHKLGWRILIIWSCQLQEQILRKLEIDIRGRNSYGISS